jgi:hypothetical protein
MKKNVLIGFIAWLFIALIAASNSYATSNSFTYTETYKDMFVKAPWGYEVIGTGKIVITAKILLNTSTISWDTINGDTVLGIYFEDFQFEEQLKNASINGNGGFFDLTKRKARFVYSGAYYPYWTTDDNEKYINYNIIDVTWSKTQLTIKVTCLTSPYDIQFPLIAYYYLGDYESRSIATDNMIVDALISIDDVAVGFFDMKVTGSLKYKEVKKKYGSYYDYFDTWNISVKSSGIGTVQ